jgi:hypothetical protein
MTTFYTFKRNVRLLPGQIVGFVRGAGYYAKTVGKPAPKPNPTPQSPGLKALARAKVFIGTRENPSGSNRTAFGEWFGMNGVSWCNIFTSYCFFTGAGYQLCKGFVGPGVSPRGCAYVPTTEAWLRATGMWIGRVPPKPGDIAIYNWDGGVPDHIGIVESVQSATEFTAIEGNTAIGNDSNGGEVMRRQRHISNVNGFGRVTYAV